MSWVNLSPVIIILRRVPTPSVTLPALCSEEQKRVVSFPVSSSQSWAISGVNYLLKILFCKRGVYLRSFKKCQTSSTRSVNVWLTSCIERYLLICLVKSLVYVKQNSYLSGNPKEWRWVVTKNVKTFSPCCFFKYHSDEEFKSLLATTKSAA